MSRALMLLILLVPVFMGCKRPWNYQEYETVEDHTWHYNDARRFHFDIRDTTIAYNLYLSVRHSGDYDYRNIWVRMTIINPTGQVLETLKSDLPLANKSGAWRGQGLGDIIDHQFLIGKGIRFSAKGTYTVKVEHIMRVDALEGIMDLGIRLGKAVEDGE